MATITTDTYLDSGTARTAGESWTINGGILTVRTDTRWHVGSPANMTGSLGTTTISATLGGGLYYDATSVRWMPFDSGSGTVPSIGTTITQGAVSGYLLGVWADLTSAPTAVGADMPSSGYIKFREVTSGPFTTGALSGISANATGPDVVGWIEIVRDQISSSGNTINVPRLGFFRTRGDWFELGTTNGSAGQTFQIPTNGGGSTTHAPGCWIETSSGSNTYEFYPSLLAAVFITTNLGTDARSKFVCSSGNGVLVVGGDGAAVTTGYVPPSGCKVRIPNIICRQCTTAARATNAAPHATLTTRPTFTTTSAGEIDVEYMISDWYHVHASPYRVTYKNSAIYDILSVSNMASSMTLENFGNGNYNGSSIPLTVASSLLGATITNCKFYRVTAGSSGYVASIATSVGFNFTNCHFGVVAYARNASGYAGYIDQSTNINFTNCKIYTNTLAFNSSFDCIVDGLDYCDRIVGTTNSTTGTYIVRTQTSCNNIMVKNTTIGLGGTIDNLHPYAGLFYTINSVNITFRNVGTRASPVGGTTNAPAYIYQDGGVCDNIRVQQCYLNATRTSLYLTLNTSKNILVEHCYGTVGSLATAALNTTIRNVKAASNSTTGQAACYGTHWFDMFTSDTVGRVWLAFNEPSSMTSAYYTAVQLGVGAGFTSGGQISMPNLNDEIIFEMPYYIKGHTGFGNSAPTITGTNTGNFTITYQIDKNDGNSWNGTWLTLNAANLYAETGITASLGFKLKFRMLVATANSTNALTYIRIDTTSTAESQDNLYPLDYTTINISGFLENSRVYVRDTTNSVDIYNSVVTGTSMTYSTGYIDDFDVLVRVMYMSGTAATLLEEFTDVVTINGLTKTVSLISDWVYVSNGIDGSTVTGITIDYASNRVRFSEATTTWPSIYARRTYRLYQENGISEKTLTTYMEAIDTANYILSSFKLKNETDPNVPVSITGGWAIDSVTRQSVDLIDNTGGSIFNMPEHVVAYQTSGSGGSTPSEIWAYSSRTLSDKTNFSLSSAEHTNITTDVQNGLTTYTAAKKKDVIAASQM